MTLDSELSVADALDLLAATIEPVRDVESLRVGAAAYRVLAEALIARVDLPAFDSAAMDGFAIRAIETKNVETALRIVGVALAGHLYPGRVGENECVRITTGAAMPPGASAVVMHEDTKELDGSVSVHGPVPAGRNVRVRGEHVRRGEVVLARARRLGAAELGLAAAIGHDVVPLVRRLKLGVLSTGDELNDAPQPLAPGSIYDGNRPMLAASLSRAGYEMVDLGICEDKPAALGAAIDRAFALKLDALITTGGGALGEADVVRQLSALRFTPLNVRPGRGLLSGQLLGGATRLHVFGLPGNAVAAFVMLQLMVHPLLSHLAGGGLRRPITLRLPLAHAVRGKEGRIDYRRGRLLRQAEQTTVELLREQGSAMLRTVADADVLVAIGPAANYATGDAVEVIPLAALD